MKIKELEFVRQLNGYNIYQLKFTWISRQQVGPMVFQSASNFVLTAASKDGKVSLNLRDDKGLNATTDEMTDEELAGKWQKFFSILSGHEIPKPV